MTLQNIILKQLAFENANEECQSMLRPIQETSSPLEYLKAYKDIRSNFHRTKLATLETFNVQKATNAKCFNCGKPSHMKKQCRMPTQARKNNTTFNKKRPPGIGPRCKKGFHWLNECHSKFDKDGNTLTPDAQQKQQGPSSSPVTKGGLNVMMLQAATSKSACIDIPSPYDMN